MDDNFGFKFAIGSIVESVGSETVTLVDRSNYSINSQAGPKNQSRFHVVERILQQCPGGVQRHYKCRSVLPFGVVSSELFCMNEIELRESEPFKVLREEAPIVTR